MSEMKKNVVEEVVPEIEKTKKKTPAKKETLSKDVSSSSLESMIEKTKAKIDALVNEYNELFKSKKGIEELKAVEDKIIAEENDYRSYKFSAFMHECAAESSTPLKRVFEKYSFKTIRCKNRTEKGVKTGLKTQMVDEWVTPSAILEYLNVDMSCIIEKCKTVSELLKLCIAKDAEFPTDEQEKLIKKYELKDKIAQIEASKVGDEAPSSTSKRYICKKVQGIIDEILFIDKDGKELPCGQGNKNRETTENTIKMLSKYYGYLYNCHNRRGRNPLELVTARAETTLNLIGDVIYGIVNKKDPYISEKEF